MRQTPRRRDTTQVVAVEILVALMLALLAGSALTWLGLYRPAQADTRGTPVVPAATHSSGAVVPWSTVAPQTAAVLLGLVPVTETEGSVSYGERGPDGAGLVLEIISSLDEVDVRLPSVADLPTITGPVARAVQALAGSERLVSTAMNKLGYAVVAVPPGTTWMVAHGQRVAQAVGEAGRAGARARVAGDGALGALAPELIAVGAALAAEYVIVAKIEQAGRMASLVHQRRVSEALAAGDAGRALVGRARRWSDDAREWPDVLVQQLVDVHAQLAFQARASNRMRELVLRGMREGSPSEEDGSRPVKPGSGGPAAAGAELAAGYEAHASAAQVAAARLRHALAHGDNETASVLLLDLAEHLDDLRNHHQILDALSNQRPRWVRNRWGATIESIATAHAPFVDRFSAGARFLLTLNGDGDPALKPLPPGTVDSTSSAIAPSVPQERLDTSTAAQAADKKDASGRQGQP